MRKKLDKILMQYIHAFEKKQDVTLEFAVSDDLMGVVCFGDVLYFNINEIVYDIDTNQPKGLILDWLYDSLDNEFKRINYYSYSKGLRFDDVEERLFKEIEVREMLELYKNEKITFSRFVEMMNQKVWR